MNKEKAPKSEINDENLSSDTSQTGGAVESPFFPCYLCGEQFRVPEIYDHEEKCLKIWKEENDKLPPHRRKKIPQKEDIKFTPSGHVDFAGTFNRIWENHLAELVPCRRCGRTFAPDRLDVHERACKGDGGKKKSKR